MSGSDRQYWGKLLGGGVAVLIAAAGVNAVTNGAAGQKAEQIQDALNPGPSVSVPAASVATARQDLPKLTVRQLDHHAGYSRAQFGPAWEDTAVPGVVNKNRCDTRDDILRRDLTGVQPTAGCTVRSGTLNDPYTGKTITFSKTHAAAVQIDHVVALGEAWQQGAAGWDASKRQQLANDPRNLLAVDGPTNIAKSDKTADDWFPRAAFQCKFSVTVIRVKDIYGLSVTQDEHDALERMLRRCP